MYAGKDRNFIRKHHEAAQQIRGRADCVRVRLRWVNAIDTELDAWAGPGLLEGYIKIKVSLARLGITTGYHGDGHSG